VLIRFIYTKKIPQLLKKGSGVGDENGSSEIVETERAAQSGLYSHYYVELEDLLNRILYNPIRVQLDIVNKSLVTYFLFDLRLDAHLGAIRQYLLFENGTFAQCFVEEIFEAMTQTAVKDYVSPVQLNDALNKAAAQVKGCPYVQNVAIRIARRQRSDRMKSNDPIMSCLDRIELVYKLEWPLNVVVSDEAMLNYNRIFGFFLKIKFVLQALNQLWQLFKRHGIV
jgi:hypothetical protein